MRLSVRLSLAIMLAAACEFTIAMAAGNPPSITGWNINGLIAGDPAFLLIIDGAGFVSGSSVRWNGSPLNTTIHGATQLTADVPASLIASPGTGVVKVLGRAW